MSYGSKLFICILLGGMARWNAGWAQPANTILFSNPSFEDLRTTGRPPSGWFNCGFMNESPPDVQPGSFSVSLPAQHGNTYLGMVVRDNETWEKVGQRLSTPLQRGKCYEMTIYLCHSDSYWSISQLTRSNTNYNTPVVLRVWGGNSYCAMTEKLAETPPINHTDWKPYMLKLSPLLSNYTHIALEAYYKPGTLFAYNGNLLSDNLSYITEIACPTVAATRPVARRSRSETAAAPPVAAALPPSVTAKEAAPEPQITTAAVPLPVQPPRQAIVRRKVIRAKILYFDINQFTIPAEYDDYLKELAIQLKTSAISIEAGGHTNNNAADKFALELSEKRAKAVADRLLELGAPAERVTFKGYGKTQPMDSNLVEEGREKNQRVEISIWETEN